MLATSLIISGFPHTEGPEGGGRAVKINTVGVSRHRFLPLVVMHGIDHLLTLSPDLRGSRVFRLSHFVSCPVNVDESAKRIFFLTSNQNWLY